MNRCSRLNPCRICGGWDNLPRGDGRRCFGFLSDDGRYAHCTREEFAGQLTMHPNSNTYPHALEGECGCGKHHNGVSTPVATIREPRCIVATYNYRNADGALLFQVTRYSPKAFSQRRPDGRGGWIWNLMGVERPLYRLPQLLAASPDQPVFVTEGEKDADNLAGLGLIATTNAGGAGKWQPKFSEVLRGRDVVLLPDRDEPGERHMRDVAQSLQGIARSIKVIKLPNLPARGDVSDWLRAGGTADDLLKLLAEAAVYTPTKDSSEPVPLAPTGLSTSEELTSSSPHLTDFGNARRLVRLHGNDLRFCHAWKKWLAWDGTRWAVDCDGEVERRAKQTVMTIYAEAAAEPDEHERKKIANWACASESRNRIIAMIELAKTEPGIPVAANALDADHFLLNCQNGTIDLRTGQLREHRREDYCTKRVDIDYDPHAECPTFQTFLHEIMMGIISLISFLQRAVGYALTGSVIEQVIFLFYGTGSNGKTTLIERIKKIMGDYASKADSTLLLARKHDGVRNDVARLAGKRFVMTDETEDGRHLAEACVKQLTGGDTVTARFLYGEFFEFAAQLKLFVSTNHKPHIRGTDHGIWRRIRLVPFVLTVSDEQKDKYLAEKLDKELPGILRWAVEGCLMWQKEGLGVPSEVADATQEYREEMDVLGAFLSDCCARDASSRVPVKDLYAAYSRWCQENGERLATKRDFGMRLNGAGFGDSRDGKARYRTGLRLVTQVTQHDMDFGKPRLNDAREGTPLKPMSHPSPTSQAATESDRTVMEEVEF